MPVNKMDPLISVIVPVYKVENYIKDTISSIIDQEYQGFELILIDDGSPDNSASIAEELLKESDLAFSIIHTKNRGVSAARNTGLRNAKGRFVIMVDADDMLVPDFLKKYVALIQDYPNCNIYSTSFTIYRGNRIIEQSKEDYTTVEYEANEAQVAFFHRSPRFLLPTLMYSKEFLDNNQIYFDEAVRFSEDVQFIWRSLALNSEPLVHSSWSGYNYVLHEGSTMTASGVQKILTGCEGVLRLDETIHEVLSPSIRDVFVPMWFFSMLHGAAKMLPFPLFKDLYNQSGSRQYIKKLRKYSSGKVKWVSTLMLVAPSFGYKIMKKH